MSESVRVFVAIALSELVREAIRELAGGLRGDVGMAQWVRPENLHLTLAFLGDLAEAEVPSVIAAVGAGAASGPLPFELELRGLGAFPNPKRPRVLWAGLAGEDLPRLVVLQRAVAAACARAGHPADERFHPHVTLARFRPGRVPDVTSAVEARAGWSGGTVGVREMVVYASNLWPRGPVYRAIGRCGLRDC